MKVDGKPYHSIWVDDDGTTIVVIDQTELPARFVTRKLRSLADVVDAIRAMRVRGAPLIGVAAAFGVALAMRDDPADASLRSALSALAQTRPTAVNLRIALARMEAALTGVAPAERAGAAYREARSLAEIELESSRQIGEVSAGLLRERWRARPNGPLNVLTHCNAGWLATVDWGTALAGIYRAHDEGVPLHVWVDETRPRNQGLLTQWELAAHGVPHTVVVDNTGGHLMSIGRVDVCVVGADRITRQGDVANKIGTYLKALAAFDNQVPFFVAAPSSTIDWSAARGDEIPIEDRPASELAFDPSIPVLNPAFDITPARLVTLVITERGMTKPDRLLDLYPERA